MRGVVALSLSVETSDQLREGEMMQCTKRKKVKSARSSDCLVIRATIPECDRCK